MLDWTLVYTSWKVRIYEFYGCALTYFLSHPNMFDSPHFGVSGWVEEFPDERAFVVPDILREKVANNELGRKSGKGFYHWDGDKRGDPVSL